MNCIACGHPLSKHSPPGHAGGCNVEIEIHGYLCNGCPCRLSERVYTRAEVLAYGERVRAECSERAEDYVEDADLDQPSRDEVSCVGLAILDDIDLAALLDEEGT